MSISRRTFLINSAIAGVAAPFWLQRLSNCAPASEGSFQPNWESLAAYRCPDWFRDAKFGIWAHWGPQCQPGQGDWYARQMYQEGNNDYLYQCKAYGHPSAAGFKDVIRDWKAEDWDPDHLISLYKAAGAKYFMCLANHHDNFDNYASSHQPWNSVNLGPKRDIVGGWEKAARAAGLRFAVSVHAAHAWSFYETSQGSDTHGPLAGVPYDGHLTKADGAGHWWEGYDPQDLYAQAHTPMGLEWDWNNNSVGDLPTTAYIEKFYRRTIELIDRYHPDQVYFDDTVLPFNGISDAGLRIVSHMYNQSVRRHGKVEAVVNGKILSDIQRKCLVMDLERGISNRIEPQPFQTDTCIGNWHYDVNLYHNHGYKSAEQVAHMLVDIVSKNGNLMLNIPLPGSGKPDDDEMKFLTEFTRWMAVNGSGIHGTRPWHIYGEGPSGGGPATHAQGFNESNRRFTSHDFRFMTRGNSLFAFGMDWPSDGRFLIRSLATGSGRVRDVRLLGYHGKIKWTQTGNGLAATMPDVKPCDFVYGLEIVGGPFSPMPIDDGPIVIEPSTTGIIRLFPADAILHGDSPQIETKGGVDDIGFWTNIDDTVSWDFDVHAAGSYTVTVDAAFASDAGRYAVEIGGQSIEVTAKSTGSWDAFTATSIGSVTVTTTGKTTLTVRPMSDWKAIALRSITLAKE